MTTLPQEARFEASELHADGSLQRAAYRYLGTPDGGWTIERNGQPWLILGPGYELLRTLECGVCSTDLARPHLPFPLPQIVGHELVAQDRAGRRYVVEINASHQALGVEHDCAMCKAGLPTHCPQRIVLGIHDLPGGFGPWVLAPRGGMLEIPDSSLHGAAVLVEPFAAALHAIETVAPRAGDSLAVLGPRRLGMLVIAAGRAWARRAGIELEIVALSRRPELLRLAAELGATRGQLVDGTGDALPDALADVVIDTTGHPTGLELAIRLARREVHLKSTHGRQAAGLTHLTELVVDEISLDALPQAAPDDGRFDGAHVAWLAGGEPAAWLARAARLTRVTDPARALAAGEAGSDGGLARADVAVVDSTEQIDRAIRPRPGREVALVRPRGSIAIDTGELTERSASPLVRAISARDLRLSTSRCGSFATALDLMRDDPALQRLSELLVTHRFASSDLAAAFATASSAECVKAVVEHPAAP